MNYEEIEICLLEFNIKRQQNYVRDCQRKVLNATDVLEFAKQDMEEMKTKLQYLKEKIHGKE